MTKLISKVRAQGRTEAQAFFAEAHPFPMIGALILALVTVDVAIAIGTLAAGG
jgi:hypothetical protein